MGSTLVKKKLEQCRGLRKGVLILNDSIISDPGELGKELSSERAGKGSNCGLGRRRKFVRCALPLSVESEWSGAECRNARPSRALML